MLVCLCFIPACMCRLAVRSQGLPTRKESGLYGITAIRPSPDESEAGLYGIVRHEGGQYSNLRDQCNTVMCMHLYRIIVAGH